MPKISDVELDNRFGFHTPPDSARQDLHTQVRDILLDAARDIVEITPTSREQSLALTHLE